MDIDDLDTQHLSKEVLEELARAKAKAALAEARKTEAEAIQAEAEAEESIIKLEKAKEVELERKADNKFQRILVFEGAVGDATVNTAIKQLDVWRRIDPGCDITLRIYSPGGDVISGMYLFDYLLGLRRAGHRLVTEAYGYAASMGGILLQAGDVRRVGAESYILIHEISFGVRGKVGEVEDEMEFVKKISDRVLTIFGERAKQAGENGTAAHPLSKAQFKRRWSRKDWWLTSEEALDLGVVDEVI